MSGTQMVAKNEKKKHFKGPAHSHRYFNYAGQ